MKTIKMIGFMLFSVLSLTSWVVADSGSVDTSSSGGAPGAAANVEAERSAPAVKPSSTPQQVGTSEAAGVAGSVEPMPAASASAEAEAGKAAPRKKQQSGTAAGANQAPTEQSEQ